MQKWPCPWHAFSLCSISCRLFRKDSHNSTRSLSSLPQQPNITDNSYLRIIINWLKIILKNTGSDWNTSKHTWTLGQTQFPRSLNTLENVKGVKFTYWKHLFSCQSPFFFTLSTSEYYQNQNTCHFFTKSSWSVKQAVTALLFGGNLDQKYQRTRIMYSVVSKTDWKKKKSAHN